MNLFDRIPHGLFAALTGRNNRRAWDLLVRLSDRYFGPDACLRTLTGTCTTRSSRKSSASSSTRGGSTKATIPCPIRPHRCRSRPISCWHVL